MSNSPFEFFRRYLKPAMVATTVLALIAFVALPALQQYQQTGGGRTDATLATYDGKELKRDRVQTFTRQHYEIVNFLTEVANETIQRKGMPRTSGFVYNAQTQQIQDLGILSSPSEIASIRTLQFAGEATKAGLELDDAAIRMWLSRFVDGTMSEGDIIQRWMVSTKNRLGQYHLYVALRQLLLAQAFLNTADAGLSAGDIPGMGEIPVTTPAQQWENFLKLQQQASVDTYGVLVADFVDKTDANPSESDIQDVFDGGKNLLPSDLSPEPGFRRPTVAQFEYVAANLNTFIDREVEKFTDEQLEAEYQKRITGGDFVIPQDEDDEPSLDGLGLSEEPADENNDADTSTDDAAPADAPEMTETSVESSAAETTGKPEPDAVEESVEKAESPESVEPSKIKEPAEPAKGDNSSVRRDSATTLVALQEDDDEADADAVDAPAPTETEAAAAANSETAEPAAKPATTPAVDVPMKDDPAAEAADDDDADVAAETPAKVETFDDVRNRIADDMARPMAAQKLDAAVRAADAKMRRYFELTSIHESNIEVGVATAKDAPTRPDLKALADENGLEYGIIGERDAQDMADEPIGTSVGTGEALNRRGPPFTITMYGFNNGQQQMAPRTKFLPLTTVDLTAGKTYVAWKTDEVESYAPTMDEARDEVIMAIRTREARKLAAKEADRIAEEINANPAKPMTELVPEDRADQIKTGLGPFSWMNMMGFGQMTIGNVPQLDSVGPKFMRSVFTTEVGKANAAPNTAERVYYVVKPQSFQPDTAELRDRFLQRSERFMAQLLTNADNQEIRNGFYRSLDERTGFKFAAQDE